MSLDRQLRYPQRINDPLMISSSQAQLILKKERDVHTQTIEHHSLQSVDCSGESFVNLLNCM
jgi:hypothetical protein